MSGPATPPDERPRRAANAALLVIQVLLVPFYLAAGSAKLAGAEKMIEFFDQIGAGHWLRYLTGTVEVIGALGLLVPRLTGLAALGLTGLMTGAVITNLITGTPSLLAFALLPLVAVLAWGRRDRTTALLRSR
ncbi:DoxX family protein [Streptomyces carminius]|uniref:DoxX family protein n=1 Tax=Streptomyces carminius TaxID=2665496 RepID=A0A2M8LVH5_9ACTN|nr:DoxX family protein [Streptomyces carminius]PJE95961.1 DoxX family protein [Streptomyces carminius]